MSQNNEIYEKLKPYIGAWVYVSTHEDPRGPMEGRLIGVSRYEDITLDTDVGSREYVNFAQIKQVSVRNETTGKKIQTLYIDGPGILKRMESS